jgi:hypothetical protein
MIAYRQGDYRIETHSRGAVAAAHKEPRKEQVTFKSDFREENVPFLDLYGTSVLTSSKRFFCNNYR